MSGSRDAVDGGPKKDGAAERQEQAVDRSPHGGSRLQDPTDERTAVGNTVSNGGLGGGSPAGGPRKTPERKAFERDRGVTADGEEGRRATPLLEGSGQAADGPHPPDAEARED